MSSWHDGMMAFRPVGVPSASHSGTPPRRHDAVLAWFCDGVHWYIGSTAPGKLRVPRLAPRLEAAALGVGLRMDGSAHPAERTFPARSSESSLAPSPSQAPGRQRAQPPLEVRRNRCRPGERQLALPSGLLRQGRGDQGSRPRPLDRLGTLQSVDSLRRRSAAAEAWRTSLVYARNSATYFHSALRLCDAANPARCRPHYGPAASFSVSVTASISCRLTQLVGILPIFATGRISYLKSLNLRC